MCSDDIHHLSHSSGFHGLSLVSFDVAVLELRINTGCHVQEVITGNIITFLMQSADDSSLDGVGEL